MQKPPAPLTCAIVVLSSLVWLGSGATHVAGAQPGKDAAATTPAVSPQEVREAFERFSTWGVPSVQGLTPVRIHTGGSVQQSEKRFDPMIALGFLVKQDGPRFTVVNTNLQEQVFEEKEATATGGKVRFESCSVDEFARRHLEPDQPDHLWLDYPEIEPQYAARDFMLGWLCWQQGRPDLAEPFAQRAAACTPSRTGNGAPPATFLQRITPILSHHLFELELMRFNDPQLSRAQLVERLETFVARFPDQDDARNAKQLVIGLQSLIAEEKDHPVPDPRDLSKLPPEEKARAMVGGLRDFAADAQPAVSGPWQIGLLGDAAVPALLAVLDDHRPSRHAYVPKAGSYRSVRLPSIGNLAFRALSHITRRQFSNGSEASPYLPSPAQPSKLRQEAEQWWAEYQRKGARQSLIDAINRADQNAVSAADQLLKLSPADAGEAIVRCYPALSATDRINLIYGMKDLDYGPWTELMQKELRNGKGDGIAAAAGWYLRSKEIPGTDAPLLAVWHSTLDDSNGGGFGVIEYLASSNDEAVIGQLVADLRRRPAAVRRGVLSALRDCYEKNWRNRQLKTTPAVQALIDKTHAEALDDDEEFWGVSGVGWHDPCVGDAAAAFLSRKLPGAPEFDRGGTWEERAAGRLACLNAWRQNQGQPAIPAPRRPTVPDAERNRIVDVVFADTALNGSPLREKFARLQGQTLNPEEFAAAVIEFYGSGQTGIRGIRARAVRSAAAHGVTIKVWSTRGKRPATWQSARWSTGVDYHGERLPGSIGGTTSQAAVGKLERWSEFTKLATEALAKPADQEVILRFGVGFPPNEREDAWSIW